jgi:regulator of protease activity HflC (stomatin/prohibitin superfamily)
MSQGEKTLFRIGRFVAVVALGLWMWILLPIAAGYVKRIPDRTKNLPFSGWLRTNMLQDKGGKYVFYDWLSGFLWSWWKWSVTTMIVIAIALSIMIIFVTLALPFTSVLVNSPVKIVAIYYLVSVVSIGYIGFDVAKSEHWDYLIAQAEPVARALLGQEYDDLTDQQKKELHRHIADVEAGINKGTWIINDGKCVLVHVPAGSFAKFGGPGVLIVPEGYVVVTERGGRISRIVGAGYYQLAQYERPQMVVYLPARAERVLVRDVLTRDKMVITSLELLVFHRADRGDESSTSGQYRYDRKVILEKIWSPNGTDWRDTVKSISDQAARDVIAQYDFEDLVAISGEARRNFLVSLVDRMNQTTKGFLGVDVIAANMGAVTISEEAKKALEEKGLVQVRRQTQIGYAEARKEAKIALGEGEREYLRKQGEGRALAAREEGLAKAEGESERVREMLLALNQLPIDEVNKLELLKTMFQGDQYRDAMRMWSSMGRSARGFVPQSASSGDGGTPSSSSEGTRSE